MNMGMSLKRRALVTMSCWLRVWCVFWLKIRHPQAKIGLSCVIFPWVSVVRSDGDRVFLGRSPQSEAGATSQSGTHRALLKNSWNKQKLYYHNAPLHLMIGLPRSPVVFGMLAADVGCRTGTPDLSWPTQSGCRSGCTGHAPRPRPGTPCWY